MNVESEVETKLVAHMKPPMFHVPALAHSIAATLRRGQSMHSKDKNCRPALALGAWGDQFVHIGLLIGTTRRCSPVICSNLFEHKD